MKNLFGPPYKCQECGRKFKTVKAAEKASFDGCPKCGGVDIDLDVDTPPENPMRPSGSKVTPNSMPLG